MPPLTEVNETVVSSVRRTGTYLTFNVWMCSWQHIFMSAKSFAGFMQKIHS